MAKKSPELRKNTSPNEPVAILDFPPEVKENPGLSSLNNEIVMYSSLDLTMKENMNTLVEFLHRLKALKTEIEDAFGPQAKAAYAAWQKANEMKKKYLAPIESAEKSAKQILVNFETEQKRIRAEEIKKECIRQEEERAKQAAALEKKAAVAAAKGNQDKADALLDKADTIRDTCPVLPQEMMEDPTKGKDGVVTKTLLTVEVKDVQAFLSWLVKNKKKIDVESFITVNLSNIKKYVQAGGSVPDGIVRGEKLSMEVRK
jgi:hypothetical protein